MLTNRIVVLGDSISAAFGLDPTEGWVNLIRPKLHWELLNESINGETSYGGLERVESLLHQHKPKLLILELGANDGLHGIPPEVIKDNIKEIISRVQKTGAQLLLLGVQTSKSYGQAYYESFNKIYLELAQQMKLALIPHLLEEVLAAGNLMQTDRLHPNADAQKLIEKKVYQHILPLIKT